MKEKLDRRRGTMESGRRRGQSFHEGDALSNEYDAHTYSYLRILTHTCSHLLTLTNTYSRLLTHTYTYSLAQLNSINQSLTNPCCFLPHRDEVEFITPAFDLNCKNGKGDNQGELDLSQLSFDDDKTSGTASLTSDEEEIDIDDDISYTRGRSRSRSVHQNDNIIAPIIPVDPNSLTPRSPSGEAGSESPKSAERSGPLHNREVLALKKGLEEATTSRNREQIKEEEEEKRAAESEKQQRSRVVEKAPGVALADAPMKRIKILVLGDSGVGKSSLILRWTSDAFNPSLVSTVGVTFKTRKVPVYNEFVQVQVWDTAGQEQFHKITTSYYKGMFIPISTVITFSPTYSSRGTRNSTSV